MSFTNKFCINCKFYKNNVCGAEGSLRHVDPVNGHTLYESAIAMRANPLMCGETGEWFVGREHKETWYSKFIKGSN